MFVCFRLKKNGQDSKEIPLIGQGFQAYIDNLFWFLPFSSQKQAFEMLAKMEISDEPWCTKRDEIKAEHLKERAPADLREGWKAWIAEHVAGKEASGPAVAVPSSGVISVIRD